MDCYQIDFVFLLKPNAARFCGLIQSDSALILSVCRPDIFVVVQSCCYSPNYISNALTYYMDFFANTHYAFYSLFNQIQIYSFSTSAQIPGRFFCIFLVEAIAWHYIHCPRVAWVTHPGPCQLVSQIKHVRDSCHDIPHSKLHKVANMPRNVSSYVQQLLPNATVTINTPLTFSMLSMTSVAKTHNTIFFSM